MISEYSSCLMLSTAREKDATVSGRIFKGEEGGTSFIRVQWHITRISVEEHDADV
jgi:hypothetical protein